MRQLISVRYNQDFSVNYEKGELVPQTEIIILVEKPKYKSKGDNIVRGSEIEELRFRTSTNGINALIGMLQQALEVANKYEQLSGAFNDQFKQLKSEE